MIFKYSSSFGNYEIRYRPPKGYFIEFMNENRKVTSGYVSDFIEAVKLVVDFIEQDERCARFERIGDSD